jgi:hypothetical protein
MKIEMVGICFGTSSTNRFFLKKNTKVSFFGGISKFLKLIVFGQTLANFDSFGQILMHCNG